MEIDFLKQDMVEITLSFFDLIIGPRVITGLPWYNEGRLNQFISEYFDFHKPGDFFCHIFANSLSFNRLFQINNPDNVRGGKRLFMLTTSIPFTLLKRKDLLQYFPSIEQLFIDWEKDLAHLSHLNQIIQDGKRENENSLQPILYKLSQYLGELQFIIHVTPDTITIPMNSMSIKDLE
ncbi:hypothetical protein [Candidatus Lokiarchaeum ossiferum]|uniref:hypothetical protein n=1 Tax=Candidatus Lokiarchaeum ossiferum TaxID=2951803 RepID=UPI00352D5035